MNFLAHAWLADVTPMDRLGGVIGDFVKGPLPAGLPPALADGVRLHRQIDTWADTHSAFLRSRARVSRDRRRVAGIMVDMFYDHFLARHWHSLHAQPLPEFTASLYALMRTHQHYLPARLRALLPYMAGEDWLASYSEAQAVAYALDRMSARLQRTDMLSGAGAELYDQYAAFEADFFDFLPAAQRFVAATVAARSAGRGS